MEPVGLGARRHAASVASGNPERSEGERKWRRYWYAHEAQTEPVGREPVGLGARRHAASVASGNPERSEGERAFNQKPHSIIFDVVGFR